MANEYVTAAAVKQSRQLTGQTYADADVDLAVETASRAIDELCKRRFWADANANQVRYYRPTSKELLRTDDLVTLTTLQTDPGGDGTYEETWTVNTDFTLEPDNADTNGRPWELIRVHPRGSYRFTPEYPRSVKVTGKFGWAAVPPAIKTATTILAGRLVLRMREAPFAIVGIGADGFAVRLAREDPDVMGLIAPFIRGGRGFV